MIMRIITATDLQALYKPDPNAHKGQNGKLLIIGGSHLFHSASLWSAKVASRIVDMVFYSSVPENNAIVQKHKEEFRDGIVVPRELIESYVYEADCILIGPGMLREDYKIVTKPAAAKSLEEVISLADSEGEETFFLTGYLLGKYPEKKWVIDAGALQMMEKDWLWPLAGHAILTPHKQEFETLFGVSPSEETVSQMAQKHNVTILLKGKEDIICSPQDGVEVKGGNAGMAKGGTGDVLAGLAAALYCKNNPFLSAVAASFINKRAGESLYERVGYYFNASDLVDEIPKVMKEMLLGK